jgi:hypothetical protein
MDVTLDSETDDLSPHSMELDEEIQRILMPLLAGCTNRRRRLQIENSVVNALVDAQVATSTDCLDGSERPCYRYVANLSIYHSVTASSANFKESIDAEFRNTPLVERLNLVPPFKRIGTVSCRERRKVCKSIW